MKKFFVGSICVFVALLACILYLHYQDRIYHAEVFEKLKSQVVQTHESQLAGSENGLTGGDVSRRWSDIQPKVKDTVVQVWVQKIDFNWLEPYKTPQQGLATGSGFFIDEKGSFITNFHVINGSVAVEVQIPSMGKQRLGAKVIALNPDRDLALVRLTEESLERVKTRLALYLIYALVTLT